MLLVVGAAGVGRGAGNWLAPPRAPLYNNSALLTQLAQPSYPPPPPAHAAQVCIHTYIYLYMIKK